MGPIRESEMSAYISVDVETAGPSPGLYSLLSIGACLVQEPAQGFYVELQPVNERSTPESLAIHGLDLQKLAGQGLPPAEAMLRFAGWLEEVVRPDLKPIFVALNAPFDWMFVNDYFHRYLGHNPFGHAALDMKAFFMGLAAVSWRESTLRRMGARYGMKQPLAHHALQDARDQADIFRRMLAEIDPPEGELAV